MTAVEIIGVRGRAAKRVAADWKLILPSRSAIARWEKGYCKNNMNNLLVVLSSINPHLGSCGFTQIG